MHAIDRDAEYDDVMEKALFSARGATVPVETKVTA
jgi:hypothetical protein